MRLLVSALLLFPSALVLFPSALLLFASTVLAAPPLEAGPARGALLPSPPANYALDDSGTWVATSPLGKRLVALLKHWPPPTLSLHDNRPEILRAIRTPGNDDLIGMVKHFEVAAPFPHVVEVTDDFEAYPKIWENVVSVKVVARDGNRVVTEWVRKPPLFFLAKIRYRMVTVTDRSQPGRVVYRHQLIDGNLVNSSDSLVVIEKIAENRTRVSVLNFINPEVGPLRAIAEGKIWKQSLQSAFKDDVAFRAHLDHPDWSPGQLSDEADRVLDQFPVDPIEYTDLIRLE